MHARNSAPESATKIFMVFSFAKGCGPGGQAGPQPVE
jgi:hypothetical protein